MLLLLLPPSLISQPPGSPGGQELQPFQIDEERAAVLAHGDGRVSGRTYPRGAFLDVRVNLA